MCNKMYNDKFVYGKVISITSIVSVQVVNYGLAVLTQTLAQSVGYHTVTELQSTVMVCTFITSYLNTAIIPILTAAELTYTPYFISWLPIH